MNKVSAICFIVTTICLHQFLCCFTSSVCMEDWVLLGSSVVGEDWRMHEVLSQKGNRSLCNQAVNM